MIKTTYVIGHRNPDTDSIAHVMEYPQLEPHLYELKNVMSRKKQMVPHLLKILARV